MGQEIAQFDWRSVGLPLDAWPETLHHAVNIVLRSTLPMLVLWGPEKRLIYNTAYTEILGSKRSTAMGRPFFEVWRQVSPGGRAPPRLDARMPPPSFTEGG